jgi:hypothetical protein
MKDPNWDLRFPRTSREAFGSSMEPDANHGDRMVGKVAVWIVIFLVGYILGSLS